MGFNFFITPFLMVTLTIFSGAANAWSPNYTLPLDRPYSNRNTEPALLEQEHERVIKGNGPMSFVYPRPCFSDLDSSQVCPELFHLKYQNYEKAEAVGLRTSLAGEYREKNPGYMATLSKGDGIMAYEGGFLSAGGKGPLSFFVDARTFSQNLNNDLADYYDREPVDTQKKSVTGTVSFQSYSRYRANMSLDLPFARLTMARDAVQWGPGLFTNLVFQQEAIPFNQYQLQFHVGPISITSLYGDLLGTHGNLEEKNLYAHRYEWRVTNNLVVGGIDQMVLIKDQKSYFFLPVMPLFISKGYLFESNNNGMISADIAYRIPGHALIYSEFLLDDMESPSSLLLKDYRANKWGIMFGAQYTGNLCGKNYGLVGEYSRVEPWTYSHFPGFPAEASNGDALLGNPFGPNSQVLIFKGFTRPIENFYASAKLTLLWKGQDSGSVFTDNYLETDVLLPKTFLNGVEAPEVTVSPFVSYTWRYFHGEAEMDIQRNPAFYLRLQVFY